jgi:hypothetical protein
VPQRLAHAQKLSKTLPGEAVPVESHIVSHIEQIQGPRFRSVGLVKRWEELFA